MAQNTSSPYSQWGIGDIDTRDYSRYFGEGGTALARRDTFSYNSVNPASLTALREKNMLFDIAFSGQVASYQAPGADTSLGTSKDFIVKRITLAFKLNNKLGFAIGFKPYSTVSYLAISTQPIGSGAAQLTRTTDGTGGINEVYFSLAKTAIAGRLSIGATASYLFGTVEQMKQYKTFDPGIPYSNESNTTIQDINSYYGAGIEGGIQYTFHPGRSWTHQVGATAAIYSTLKGQTIRNYTDSNNLAVTPLPQGVADGTPFKMPFTAGFGYAAVHNSVRDKNHLNTMTYSVDAHYYGWPKQATDMANSYTNSAFRFSAGLEFAHKTLKYYNNKPIFFENYYIGVGAAAQNSYMIINGNYLKEYAGSIGAGVNPSGSLSLFAGLEFGVRGNLNEHQIKESFTNICLGMTLKNLWFGTKKYGRFR